MGFFYLTLYIYNTMTQSWHNTLPPNVWEIPIFWILVGIVAFIFIGKAVCEEGWGLREIGYVTIIIGVIIAILIYAEDMAKQIKVITDGILNDIPYRIR